MQSAVIVDDMGIHIRNHFDLCLTGVSLNRLHITAVDLQLVCDTDLNMITNSDRATAKICKAGTC